MVIIDGLPWIVDLPDSKTAVRWLLSTHTCIPGWTNLYVLARANDGFIRNVLWMADEDMPLLTDDYLRGINYEQSANWLAWWPRFIPCDDSGNPVLSEYRDLPDGYETTLGALKVGSKTRNILERLSVDTMPLSYRAGDISIVDSIEKPPENKIPVFKLGNSFYPKAPLLRNVSARLLYKSGLLQENGAQPIPTGGAV